MKTVYIAHPISGNVRKNKKSIYKIMEQLIRDGDVIPFAPYLTTLKILDDENPVERAIGIELNKSYFVRHAFDELWVYGDHVSSGVKAEIELAFHLGIQIRPISNAAFSYMRERMKEPILKDFTIQATKNEMQLIFNALEFLINHKEEKIRYMTRTGDGSKGLFKVIEEIENSVIGYKEIQKTVEKSLK